MAFRKSSTFTLQSKLQDELAINAGHDLTFLFPQDPPLFEAYHVSPLPELSDKSDSDSESSDSEDDLDPYRFHSSYSPLAPVQDSLKFESFLYDDVPYFPTVDLDEFARELMLPFEDTVPQDHQPHSPSTLPLYLEPSELSDASNLVNAITFSINNHVQPELTHTPPSYEDVGSDVDAEGDSDYDPTDDDDEYIPDLEYPASKKRRASSQLDRFSPEPFPISSASPSSSTSSRGSSVVSNKRPRTSFPSRNLQVSENSTLKKVSKSDPWACPFQGCAWVQRNRRSPDLKRHIRTHSRSEDEWVCCGIPADKAKYYEREMDQTYEYKGKLMVGGCMKTFARRDALKRHLDNQNIRCVGNLNCYFD